MSKSNRCCSKNRLKSRLQSQESAVRSPKRHRSVVPASPLAQLTTSTGCASNEDSSVTSSSLRSLGLVPRWPSIWGIPLLKGCLCSRLHFPPALEDLPTAAGSLLTEEHKITTQSLISITLSRVGGFNRWVIISYLSIDLELNVIVHSWVCHLAKVSRYFITFSLRSIYTTKDTWSNLSDASQMLDERWRLVYACI